MCLYVFYAKIIVIFQRVSDLYCRLVLYACFLGDFKSFKKLRKNERIGSATTTRDPKWIYWDYFNIVRIVYFFFSCLRRWMTAIRLQKINMTAIRLRARARRIRIESVGVNEQNTNVCFSRICTHLQYLSNTIKKKQREYHVVLMGVSML